MLGNHGDELSVNKEHFLDTGAEETVPEEPPHQNTLDLLWFPPNFSVISPKPGGVKICQSRR